MRRVGERGQQAVDDAGGHKGAGGIMDHDDVGRIVGERFEAVAGRLLPGRTAGDGRRQGEARDCCVIQRAVVGVDDDRDGVDAGMRQQALDGVAQQRLAGDRAILLGRATAGADALSGGDDQGVDGHGALH